MKKLVLNDRSRQLKVISTLKQELRNCSEFWFYTAFVTSSGVACLKQELLDAEARGTAGKILVSKYQDFTEPEALRDLMRFKNLELRIAEYGSMHAKGYFFRHAHGETHVIGSSNWTANALCTNQELNIAIAVPKKDTLSDAISEEFSAQFASSTPVTASFINGYEHDRAQQPVLVGQVVRETRQSLVPNAMQLEACDRITNIIDAGERRALVISATGTGKTYLAAFHAQRLDAKRLLFVVHRENIARKAMRSFKNVFHDTRTYGLYTGHEKCGDADFVFSTVQTLSREKHLRQFNADTFDYVVIDESHRAAASSYKKFTDYFSPKVLLGMTATPERTDGGDVFGLFDHNVAYEIRLQQALEEEMLSPFHYYGISDIAIDGVVVDEKTDFSKLASEQRIDHIVENAERYGHWGSKRRGLIFCSRVDEAKEISEGLNRRGLRTVALSGADSEQSREDAIQRLECTDGPNSLDYIVTVDIFNEGIDIPAVNQVLMLRPTTSAIIFVQQLGRGLRRLDGKDKYLTVIDFIGNYQNNYLIPIALYGDTTYDKDRLRRLVYSGDNFLPGASTVSFDQITRERIFSSINSSNAHLLKDLKADFNALRVRLGRMPMMVDFQSNGLREPQQFGTYAKGSYRDFLKKIIPDELSDEIDAVNEEYLAVLSKEILNGSSIEEPLVLLQLCSQEDCLIADLVQRVNTYGINTSEMRIRAAAGAVNLMFSMTRVDGKRVSVRRKLESDWLNSSATRVFREEKFNELLQQDTQKFLVDVATYSLNLFLQGLDPGEVVQSFVRYRRYSRSDVFRLIGKEENPVAQNVGGYLHVKECSAFPIFVTYEKEDDISPGTKYEDHFKSPSVLHYFSKNKRRLSSPDMMFLQSVADEEAAFVPIFVKKNNDEGTDFYFLGQAQPIKGSFKEDTMPSGHSVVRLDLKLAHAVPEELYNYLTG